MAMKRSNQLRETPRTSTNRTVLLQLSHAEWQALEKFPHAGKWSMSDRIQYCIRIALGDIVLSDEPAVSPVSQDTKDDSR